MRKWTLCFVLAISLLFAATAVAAEDQGQRRSGWSEIWAWIVEILDVDRVVSEPDSGLLGQAQNDTSARLNCDEEIGPTIIPSGIRCQPENEDEIGPTIIPSG